MEAASATGMFGRNISERAASKAMVMDIFGITPGSKTIKALRLQDQSRIKAASKKVSDKYQKQRQKLRAQKSRKVTRQVTRLADLA
ncbi:Hypothetical predicted protein [Paramuricea clavata]|uniref:Uncharacterized protein n=1 Tax=Paramuricea clavata TaxID=317549 RepID=A0A7D9J922_PARCT|nr:Hypothetical predicted protein [Paramuricea clavata]